MLAQIFGWQSPDGEVNVTDNGGLPTEPQWWLLDTHHGMFDQWHMTLKERVCTIMVAFFMRLVPFAVCSLVAPYVLYHAQCALCWFHMHPTYYAISFFK